MIGILVITHGAFSKGIVQSMELICGKQDSLTALTLNIEDDVEALAQAVQEQAARLDQGDGVLVLVDMLGGSPANVAARILRQPKVACLTGLNLPMLLEAVSSRTCCTLAELASLCMESGQAGIIDLNARLLSIAGAAQEKG